MLRQGVVGLLVVALANTLYGYPLPVDTRNVGTLAVSGLLFVAYVVLMRTLFRLPFGVVAAVRRYRHARQGHGLGARAALVQGVQRGLLDTRVWESRIGALLDRFLFVLIVWWGCGPGVGALLVRGLGLLGVLLLLGLYIYTGTFRGLVGDALALRGGGRPFGSIPNLRRPPDDF